MLGTTNYQKLSDMLYREEISQEEYDLAVEIVRAETGFGPEAEKEANSGLALRMSFVRRYLLLSVTVVGAIASLVYLHLYIIGAAITLAFVASGLMFRDANHLRLAKGVLFVQQGFIRRRHLMIPVEIISKVEPRSTGLQLLPGCCDVDLYLRGDKQPLTIKGVLGSEQLVERINLYRCVTRTGFCQGNPGP